MRTLLFTAASSSPDEIRGGEKCAGTTRLRNGCQMLSYKFRTRCGFAATTFVRQGSPRDPSKGLNLSLSAFTEAKLREGRLKGEADSVLPEVLRQTQSLSLVIGANPLPVNRRRRLDQTLEHQPSDDLAVFEDERHFAAPDL